MKDTTMKVLDWIDKNPKASRVKEYPKAYKGKGRIVIYGTDCRRDITMNVWMELRDFIKKSPAEGRAFEPNARGRKVLRNFA